MLVTQSVAQILSEVTEQRNDEAFAVNEKCQAGHP